MWSSFGEHGELIQYLLGKLDVLGAIDSSRLRPGLLRCALGLLPRPHS